MKGAYYCPHCKTPNACDCATCKEHITIADTVVIRVGGNALQCGKCGKQYSYDQALDTEWELKIKPLYNDENS